jgi:hypothetical protein
MIRPAQLLAGTPVAFTSGVLGHLIYKGGQSSGGFERYKHLCDDKSEGDL